MCDSSVYTGPFVATGHLRRITKSAGSAQNNNKLCLLRDNNHTERNKPKGEKSNQARSAVV